ncbi:hypothetical protein M3_0180 [Lysinibacillus phage vB_LfM_LysYB1]|nr:hypothetical protein M3_0180 [Lysinibacillus phage vB_LfM_LysYB1]WAB25308.1 hypothetical protein M5_0130 [Lysinibacillus phage vB_LfM_LysYB2]
MAAMIFGIVSGIFILSVITFHAVNFIEEQKEPTEREQRGLLSRQESTRTSESSYKNA